MYFFNLDHNRPALQSLRPSEVSRDSENVFEKVRAHVPTGGPITVDVFNKLLYLRATVKETFR